MKPRVPITCHVNPMRLRAAHPKTWALLDASMPTAVKALLEEVMMPHPYNPQFGVLRQLHEEEWLFVSLALEQASESLSDTMQTTVNEKDYAAFDIRRRRCLRLARLLSPTLAARPVMPTTRRQLDSNVRRRRRLT